jgi:hypothetical protein
MRTLAMMCALVGAIAGVASAQSVTDTVSVQLDRPVIVNGVELPAGHLTIQVLSTGGSGSTALMVRADSGAEAGVLANRLYYEQPKARDGATLILTPRGNAYVLDQVWMSENIGYQVLRPAER